jgi:hypothetical protein
MTIHAPAYAKYHRYGSHTKATSSRVPLWANMGVPHLGVKCLQLRYVALAGLSGGLGWRGDWLHGFQLVGFLPTGCRSLVRGIGLVLLQAGDVKSSPGPDRGSCVVCKQTPAENARALLRCREGCGRESHYKEACSGLQGGEQHQGNWACGLCVVFNGGWVPPSPNLVKCCPRRHSTNPFVKGLLLVNRDLLVRPGPIISHTSLLL